MDNKVKRKPGMAAQASRLYTIIAIGLFAVLSVAVALTAITVTRNSVTSRSTYTDGERDGKKSCPLTANKLREALQNVCKSREDLLLKVSFDGEQLVCGKPSTKEKTSVKPTVELKHADKNAQYTVLMLDPDAPSHSLEGLNFYLHWANINDIVFQNHQKAKAGSTLMNYMGPSPPKGTGAHRYQMIVFESTEQNGNIELDRDITDRKHFKLYDFVKKNNLCNIVGLFEFTVAAEK
ncbi:protein D3-like isoform X2 [Ruditapes philippinarum]|uniref:protein D3-like isoform X2 n=1 Tax=Ruditapes philippinarum TaxID=129788 RepID=UPI00295C22EE|nr:protein D3-like isoform X2 [Ruditapes philippinarum]